MFLEKPYELISVPVQLSQLLRLLLNTPSPHRQNYQSRLSERYPLPAFYGRSITLQKQMLLMNAFDDYVELSFDYER